MMLSGRSFSGRERNCCFLNTGQPRFANISAVSGFDFPDDARAVSVVDWDADGMLDLWVLNRTAPRLRFLRNTAPRLHHYVSIGLRGNGTDTNRDGIGARVEVVCPDRTLIRTLRAGEAFLSQSGKWLHFGLGDAAAVQKIVVRWSPDDVEEYRVTELDRRYLLQQGTGQVQPVEAPASVSLSTADQTLPPEDSSARIFLRMPLPMLGADYLDSDGTARPIPLDSGQPFLISLWASWCAPCREELTEFGARESDLRQAGLDILALSVDGLDNDSGDVQAGIRWLKKIGFPFASGRATPELLQNLQSLHNRLVPSHRTLPIPVSFLISGSGELMAIYKGRIDPDQLLKDLTPPGTSRRDRWLRAAHFAGSVIDDPRVEASEQQSRLKILFRLAEDVHRVGRIKEAARYYRESLMIAPDLAKAHNNLGTVLAAQGQWAAAQQEFTAALSGDGRYPEAHFNLGTVHEQQGRLAEAAECYREAVSQRPDYLEALFNLGNVLVRQGQLTEAAVQYEQVLKIRPEHAGARQNLLYVKSQLQ